MRFDSKDEVVNFVDALEGALREYLASHGIETDLCVRDAVWDSLEQVKAVKLSPDRADFDWIGSSG